jgi:hypothetical protein
VREEDSSSVNRKNIRDKKPYIKKKACSEKRECVVILVPAEGWLVCG